MSIATIRKQTLAVVDKVRFLGPTLARVTIGLVFIGTGWGKLHSLDQVTQFFTDLGLPYPDVQARLVAATELGGGVLILAGLLTRLAALPLLVTMVVAIVTAKRAEITGVSSLVGLEEFSYLVLLLWLVVAGPGPLSIDHLITARRKAPSA